MLEIKRQERTTEILRYSVDSESEPGKKHYISIHAECTCDGNRFRGTCKHTKELFDKLTKGKTSE